jgi:hypothetical protein
LRDLVIGSPEGVRATINLLYGLTYAEQATGRQLVTIPRSGILITPEQGEVFSLQKKKESYTGTSPIQQKPLSFHYS